MRYLDEKITANVKNKSVCNAIKQIIGAEAKWLEKFDHAKKVFKNDKNSSPISIVVPSAGPKQFETLAHRQDLPAMAAVEIQHIRNKANEIRFVF